MKTNSFNTRFSRYELVRSQLFCKLINPYKNPEIWENVPYKPWLDLGLCCYYEMEEDGLSDASVMIRNSFLSMWNIRSEKVLADAWHNTEDGQRVLFCPLSALLDELREQGPESDPLLLRQDPPLLRQTPPLYVLTNTNRIFGAVYMAVPGVLNRIGKMLGENYYILPSSIHECLILPDTGMTDVEELNALVQMVNREHVAENEILADHVYYYDRTSDAVRLC